MYSIGLFESFARITLRALIFLVLICSAAPLFAIGKSASPSPTSTVFYALDTDAVDPLSGVSSKAVRRMVDNLIVAVTQRASVGQAWASLFKPSDRVGIKVSASGRSVSGTHPAVVEAIARGLISAGIPRSHILVWDRNLADLIATGYTSTNPYYVLRWVDPTDGYDTQSVVSSPIVGKLVWGDSRFGKHQETRLVDLLSGGTQLSSQSYYAKVLTREVDKVINVPSLLDSYLTGIQGALVNMTLPNLDNWRRFTKEPAYGNPYIAEVYSDAAIRPKVALTILDGLILQFAGGPYPNPVYTEIKNTVFVSFDFVAIDATAIRLIDEARVLNQLPKCAEMAGHVRSAAQMGLGCGDENAIILKRIGSEMFK